MDAVKTGYTPVHLANLDIKNTAILRMTIEMHKIVVVLSEVKKKEVVAKTPGTKKRKVRIPTEAEGDLTSGKAVVKKETKPKKYGAPLTVMVISKY